MHVKGRQFCLYCVAYFKTSNLHGLYISNHTETSNMYRNNKTRKNTRSKHPPRVHIHPTDTHRQSHIADHKSEKKKKCFQFAFTSTLISPYWNKVKRLKQIGGAFAPQHFREQYCTYYSTATLMLQLVTYKAYCHFIKYDSMLNYPTIQSR